MLNLNFQQQIKMVLSSLLLVFGLKSYAGVGFCRMAKLNWTEGFQLACTLCLKRFKLEISLGKFLFLPFKFESPWLNQDLVFPKRTGPTYFSQGCLDWPIFGLAFRFFGGKLAQLQKLRRFGALQRNIVLSMVFWQLAVACPCTRAIDRSSHAEYWSILVLRSSASTRAGQSGRLSAHHA